MQGLTLANDKPMLVLGIETTCDETAAAVVERQSRRQRKNPLQYRALADRRARPLRRRGAGDRRARPCRPARRHCRPRHEGRRRLLRAAFGGGGGRGPRPDRRRHRRAHHGESDCDGARHAADRGQSSRGACADAAADMRAGVSLLPVPRVRRPHPDRRRGRRRQLCAARHHRRRRHGRSLRQGRKDAVAALSGRAAGRACGSHGDAKAICVSAADAGAGRMRISRCRV